MDGGMGSDFGVEGEGVGGGVKVFGSFFEGVENTVLIYENENVQYKEKGGWDENEDEVGVNEEEHVDCSEAFNTYHVIM